MNDEITGVHIFLIKRSSCSRARPKIEFAGDDVIEFLPPQHIESIKPGANAKRSINSLPLAGEEAEFSQHKDAAAFRCMCLQPIHRQHPSVAMENTRPKHLPRRIAETADYR